MKKKWTAEEINSKKKGCLSAEKRKTAQTKKKKGYEIARTRPEVAERIALRLNIRENWLDLLYRKEGWIELLKARAGTFAYVKEEGFKLKNSTDNTRCAATGLNRIGNEIE